MKRERPKTAGAVTSRITTDGSHIEEVDKRTKRNDGFITRTECASFCGLEISYTSKVTDYGQARRYYVGLVQFGFVQYYRNEAHFVVHLSAQDDATWGKAFDTEAEVYNYLVNQLRAK